MKEKLKTAIKKVETEVEAIVEKVEEFIEEELRPREDSKFQPSESEPSVSPEPHEAKVGELDEHGHLIRPEKAPEHF